MRAIRRHRFNVRTATHGGHRASGCRLRRDGWELECEPASFAERAFDANATVMFFQNLLAYGQTEARAAATLIGDKHGENLVDIVWFNAATIVDDRHAGHVLGLAVLRRDFDAAAL